MPRQLFGLVRQRSTYRGRAMWCASGLHEAVGSLIVTLVPEHERTSTRVLDLGAGTGALLLRMADLGFTNLTAWDLDAQSLESLDGVSFEAVDLNTDFASHPGAADTFTIVLAVEIIEHLENPFQFIRQLERILAPEGIAIITTPNIESAVSRLKFLRLGEHRWFGESCYLESGHISALTVWQLEMALDNVGLKIVERSHNLRGALIPIPRDEKGGIQDRAAALLAAGLYPFMKGNRGGDIHVLAVKRTQQRAYPATPWRTFAFPRECKGPIHDAAHVRNSIAQFGQVEGVTDEERDEAWQRIRAAASKYRIHVPEHDWPELFTGEGKGSDTAGSRGNNRVVRRAIRALRSETSEACPER